MGTSPRSGKPLAVATIGYQGSTVPSFLDALRQEGVELLVDIRAVASSRLPGYSKTALAANLETVGIDYVHLRALGTPADGRAAARSGKPEEMRRIFLKHLATEKAQDELESLVELVRSGRRVALLCFEADPAQCHRRIVAEALGKKFGIVVHDLRPELEERA